MLEHLLLADLGALLIVLGLTGPVLQPLLRAPAAWLRVFGHPVVALALWAANFYLWHLPALYQGAVEHDAVHALQHILFVSFGIAMWMALLGPLPKPAWFGNGWKIGYIVAVRLIQSVLANALLWSSGVLYPRYAAGEAYWGITAANDQSAAGAIMMIEGSIVTILLFCWLFLRAARESEERQELVELAGPASSWRRADARACRGPRRGAARADRVAAGQVCASEVRRVERSGARARQERHHRPRCAVRDGLSSSPGRSGAPSRPRCPRPARRVARRADLARAQVRAQHVDRRRPAQHDRRPRLRQRGGQRDVVARRASRPLASASLTITFRPARGARQRVPAARSCRFQVACTASKSPSVERAVDRLGLAVPLTRHAERQVGLLHRRSTASSHSTPLSGVAEWIW